MYGGIFVTKIENEDNQYFMNSVIKHVTSLPIFEVFKM
jgi:hypothetical protein